MNDSNELAVVTAKFGDVRDTLATKERAIVVSDQATYTLAANFLIEAKSYIKDVNTKLDVGINSAKAHLDTLKNQKSGYVDPVKRLIDAVTMRAEQWRAAEKQRAEAEARRIQEEEGRKQRQKAEEDRREAERIATAAKRAKDYGNTGKHLDDGHNRQRQNQPSG